METSDLDLPLLPSAEQIRRREFASVRRGYDPEQVRDYLTQVAAQVETLERGLHGGITGDELPPRPTGIGALGEISDGKDRENGSETPYERVARRFAVVFETADAEAEEVVSRARDEATRVLTEARAEADRIRVDAQARAEEARQEGREALERATRDAEGTMEELQNRRASLVSQLEGMRTTLLTVADDLKIDGTTDAPVDVAGPTPGADGDTGSVPVNVALDDDDDPWIFESGLDIPELELTDPEADKGSTG
jgi:DivIVA domain-containing protein